MESKQSLALAGAAASRPKVVRSPQAPQRGALEEKLVVRGRAKRGAAALGLETVGNLVWHLPFRYEDRREITDIGELDGRGSGKYTIAGVIESMGVRRTGGRGRMVITIRVADATGSLPVIWFNQPWLLKKIAKNKPILIHGTYKNQQFYPNEYEMGVTKPDGTLTPVYPVNEHITSLKIRELLAAHRDAMLGVEEFLPPRVLARLGLPARRDALLTLHFPKSLAEATLARRRLAFDELFLWELTLLQRRSKHDHLKSVRIPAVTGGVAEQWLQNDLPFKLTQDQVRVIAEVDTDLSSPRSMQRLMMGEVGVGKTVCAVAAMLRAVDAGYQGALLAPTETLAEQHLATIQELLEKENINAALLAGSVTKKKRGEILAGLASGELNIIIGTHALLEDTVRFKNLGVAVVDEQHRFGVKQRAVLDGKGPCGRVPNVLHMSATPIPRSLAMTAYGDLDKTVLKERPQQRKPVPTFIVSTARQKQRMYERMREEIAAGRQVFIICPLVEESEALQVKAATEEYEVLKQSEFRNQRVLLIHGRMRSAEKQAAMREFAAGNADVLVATSVIEVGIDVPNATAVLVEDAHRYGIAQLHQLRGRVGRGEHVGLCFLAGPKSAPRLKALAEHDDGFTLSELDLQLRGRGELMGVRQSGPSDFHVADVNDVQLVKQANDAARELLLEDPELEAPDNRFVAKELSTAYGHVI